MVTDGLVRFVLLTIFNVAVHGDVVTVSITSGKLRVIESHADGSQINPINIKGRSVSRSTIYLNPGDLTRLETRRHGEGGAHRPTPERPDSINHFISGSARSHLRARRPAQ